MRSGTLGAAVLVAVLFPHLGNAQAYQVAEPAPLATAAGASWQLSGTPIVYAGDMYYPTGPTVFFDPYVMVRTGAFAGVPLYVDTTLEPYSIVYVPIGGNVMRPYEKRRAGTSEGTVGSRTPSFPVERDVDVSATTPVTGLQYPPSSTIESELTTEPVAASVSTGGNVMTTPRPAPAIGSLEMIGRPRPTHVESIPAPQSNSGIWLPYDGAKWYAAGDALDYVPSRFEKVGEYRGFPVFREKGSSQGRIYIPSVEGGPLSPYARR